MITDTSKQYERNLSCSECKAVQATMVIMSIVLCDIVFAVQRILEIGVPVVGRGCQARSYLHVNISTTAKHYR